MQQPAPGCEIDAAPFALQVGRIRPAFVRSLVPADAQPAQIFERGIGVDGAAALAVEVLHAHHQRTARLANALPSSPEGARVAHMQVACGRGRKPSAIA
jgi:hypothetical protein